jgi:ATP-binding cassette subfamily D (ALD) long-chain fatty acid import protein
MGAQSKLSPQEKTVKSVINQLTTLYLKHRTNISRTVYLTLFVALINRIRNAINEQKAASIQQAEARERARPDDGSRKKKVELNREFFKNLFRLLKIVIPGWRSTEMRLLISHSIFLVIRTLISLYVAELDGRLVSSLVRGKGRDFLLLLVKWMVVAVPATSVNAMVCEHSDRKSGPLWVACSKLWNSYPTIKLSLRSNTAHGSQSISMLNTSPT